MYNSQNLPLSPKKVIKKTIAWFFTPYIFQILIILIVFLVVSNFVSNLYSSTRLDIRGAISTTFFIIFSLILILIILVLIYEYFYYKLYFYEFAEDRAKIRKGVISRATGHVRYERLQAIYVDQDLLDRIFGLYDVHYETAGEASGFYSHVDGLNKGNADKLVAFLEEKAKQITPERKESEEISKPEIIPEKIDTEEISIRQYPLSKAVIASMTTIWTLILSIVLSIGWSMIDPLIQIFIRSDLIQAGISLIGFLLVFFASLIYSLTWYKNFYFHFGQDKGEIRTKVIGQSISYLFYDRIQNVNISQGILNRLFGIYTISIETAGEKAWMRLVINGLPKESAEKVKDFLLNKAKFYRSRL